MIRLDRMRSLIAAVAVAVVVVLAVAVGGVSAARSSAASDEPSESPMDGKWKTVNYYDLLGLERSERNSLKTSDVTKAYRTMAQRHHPGMDWAGLDCCLSGYSDSCADAVW